MTNSLVVKDFAHKSLEDFGDNKANLLEYMEEKFENHLVHEFAKIDNLVKDEPYRDLEGQIASCLI
jgi:hypothetical protein